MEDLLSLRYGIIPACDVHSLDEYQRLVEATANVKGIVGYKVGCILGLTFGLPRLVAEAKQLTDLPIIYDHQKAATDIPELGREFAAVMADSGIRAAITFNQAGPETEAAFVKGLLEKNVVPIVGGEMTHPRYLASDGGFLRDDAPLEMYELGARLGVTYFVVPGNKPASIAKYSQALAGVSGGPRLMMPGIGRQGGDIKGAFSAAGGVSCYAIVGTTIYRAANITEAARKLCEEALAFE